MVSALLASLILLAAAEPTVPPSAAPAEAAKPAASPNTVSEAVVNGKAKEDPTKLVCKSEIPVGSRLPIKHCMTRGDAAMRQLEDRQELEKMQGDTYRR